MQQEEISHRAHGIPRLGQSTSTLTAAPPDPGRRGAKNIRIRPSKMSTARPRRKTSFSLEVGRIASGLY
jgi:hypothetical protein